MFYDRILSNLGNVFPFPTEDNVEELLLCACSDCGFGGE